MKTKKKSEPIDEVPQEAPEGRGAEVVEEDSAEEGYRALINRLSSMRQYETEVDRGILCKEFANKYGLIFLGFDSRNNNKEPLFGRPSPE